MLSVISITIFFILYFFKLPSKSIISLLFGELSKSIIFLLFRVSIPNASSDQGRIDFISKAPPASRRSRSCPLDVCFGLRIQSVSFANSFGP